MSKKTTFIFGNWKMNKTKTEIAAYAAVFNKLIKKDRRAILSSNLQFGVAPTFLGIYPALATLKLPTHILAQDAHHADNGAFTSEVSALQLKNETIKYVLVGHSEMRQYQGLTDENVNAKMKTLLKNKMIPVLCVGETQSEFDKKKTNAVLEKQLKGAFEGISKEDASKVIVAYEPVWAIGTGKTATVEIVDKTHNAIVTILEKVCGKGPASKISILYGGSANDKNAKELLEIQNVNGLLVGGASLDPNQFYSIIASSLKTVSVKESKK